MKYQRFCPKCNVEIFYSRKGDFTIANKAKSLCRSCGAKSRIFSESEKEQARKQLAKVSNIRPIYDIWLEKFGKEEADNLLLISRNKKSIASSGSNNPMYGKPAPQGSGNGWSGWYKGWYFRSLRELSYMINVIEKENLEWKTPDKSFFISYKDYKGNDRTYVPDFIINNYKVVEIKPIRLHNSPNVLAKRYAAEAFCELNNLSYQIIDPLILTNEKLLSLYLDDQIKFLDKYDIKFRQMNGL